jgi:NAD(P)H-hydrate epimerase
MLKTMLLPTQLLQRKADSNKGDFGHIFILAGSAKYLGAAALCAESAMRSGAGLVTLGVPESLNIALIKIKPKEVMTLPLKESKPGYFGLRAFRQIKDFLAKVDVLVIGPGIALEKSTQLLVRKLVKTTKKATVIDADGLIALAGHLEYLKEQTILTPHPGEMARLLGVKTSFIQKNREKIARKFAEKYGIILVLKDKNTLVCDKGGNLYKNNTGNPGMSSAGSGDVLTGIIAAFLGQRLSVYESAKFGVYLHGLAGDMAAEEKTQISLIASDIIDKIPYAIKKCILRRRSLSPTLLTFHRSEYQSRL